MSEELRELSRRLVGCKSWRWMPGMLAATPPGAVWREIGADRLRIQSEWEAGGPCGAPDGAVPDLTDPATLGCILALVRQAWGDPGLYVRPNTRGLWSIPISAYNVDVSGANVGGDYPTEAEALIAALEQAP